MTRSYSEDIHERALARADAGETVRSIAKALQISPSCVTKWKELRRDTGGLSPGKIGGHKKRVTAISDPKLDDRDAEEREAPGRGVRFRLPLDGSSRSAHKEALRERTLRRTFERYAEMSTSIIGLVVRATLAFAAVLFGFVVREKRDPNPFLERSQLKRMRAISLVEGTTLVMLVFVAVTLIRFGGERMATAVMEPIHGVAFLLYVAMLIRTVAGGNFARSEIARMAVAALIPFGGFANERVLRRRQAPIDWRHMGE